MLSKIMADEAAKTHYLAIPAGAHPVRLADDYQVAKLAGDTSKCLALEVHLRQMAQLHCHRSDVRDALAQMERARARRKMGTGGVKMLQDIASQVETLYAAGIYTTEPDGRLLFTPLTGGGRHIKITCKDSPGAVALVVAKYRRGYRR